MFYDKINKIPYIIDINPRFGGGYPFTHLSGYNFLARYILNFMRGSKCLPDNSSVLKELLEEADFYCLENLMRQIMDKLEKFNQIGSIEVELHLLRHKISLMHN